MPMPPQPVTYLIKAITGDPPDEFATAGGANETVNILPQGFDGQTWQVVYVGQGKFIFESYDPNSSDKLVLSYSSNDFDGSPVTTKNRQSPSVWIILGTEAANQFILSPDIRVDADICAAVKDGQMVIQLFHSGSRPTWEFIPHPVD